jgi:hypothetical protein
MGGYRSDANWAVWSATMMGDVKVGEVERWRMIVLRYSRRER